MKLKTKLLAATSLAAGVFSFQASMQLAYAQAAQEPETIETVVVSGIRGSLTKSAQIKRDSKQIVDVVSAEDVGKLPDNNVPEALAHVTGVQIERMHGEGSSISIRGLSSVATTLNGNAASSGSDRAMNLSDIPAELLKAVTVYKSRSADQVEGGMGGTVNVDLRRPLDLPFGWTLAGSVRGVYSDLGGTYSPYTSALIANRFDTALGEMGFLLNLSYTQNNYFENFIESESPDPFFDKDQSTLPGNIHALNGGVGPIAPYAINYGVEQGATTRPSVNLSTQWKANDHLDFVLEGAYISSKDKLHRDRLHMVVRNGTYNLSNIQMMPDGQTLKSATFTSADGTSPVNGGPESYFTRTNRDEFNTNLEAHYHFDRLQVNASAQYNWSSSKYFTLGTYSRFQGATSAVVDVNSSTVLGGGPFVQFNNTDLNDVSQYRLFQLHDEVGHSKSQEFDTQADATYQVSEDWYLRSLQAGYRYSNRHTQKDFGYRDAIFYDSATTKNNTHYMPMSAFPSCGNASEKVKPDVSGADIPSWYRLSSSCILDNYAAVRNYIATSPMASKGRYDWSSNEPPNIDLTNSYNDHEYTFAGYAQANWGANLYFPVEGQLGVRAVQTWGDVLSTDYTDNQDAKGNWFTTITPHSANKSYFDVMPNANALVHFSDKLQLRLSYFYQVDRPAFWDASAWQSINVPNKIIWAGNPDLHSMREHNYDASLEYFFGKAGQVSLGYFLKKPHGWFYYAGIPINDPSSPYNGYTLYQNRNAKPGTFEGLEFSTQSFFDFLPGFWSNFGASANGTLMTSYTIMYDYLNPKVNTDLASVPGVYNAENVSRYTYNLALFYDTPEFSARLAYNYRAKWRVSVWQDAVAYSPYNDATSRLDAAVNFTPYKWVTFSVEGSNLLGENNRTQWGKDDKMPLGLRMQARTVQLSARFRY
ncbi:TonB-dependent receptor [Rhizomicrobium palustre]|uniref:TonB-dependent receptor n=1 Tax=Rhizomicrobium palustre TaxID=189966 RepID=A0A846N0Q7_9PROT|nr:TonB-dependent receptor [Rhizomicrobium palustre]NIK89488.1 TonB-dependent receptor [Rhizomicrobium palustre]